VLSFPAAKLSSALWPPAQQLAFRVWCKPQVPSKENKNVVLMGIKSDRDIKSINQSISQSVCQSVSPSVRLSISLYCFHSVSEQHKNKKNEALFPNE